MLTVVFATRNGMRTLPHVLDAYLRLDAPEGGWKLVVVDNGSTDQSREFVRSFSDRLPLTSISERKPGKNAALNAAIPLIEGDLVILTDDDTIPRADWLQRMRVAADTHPDYSIFGGVVLPRWEIAPPEWVVKWVPAGPVFTLTSPSLSEGPVEHHFIFGPNMAVRARVFHDGFRFDPTIGPQGTNYAMGSETEFVKRLGRQGHGAWHVGTAQVEHYIRDFQTKESWILGRAIRMGRGMYRMGQTENGPEVAAWRGVPRYLFRELLTQSAILASALLTFRRETLFRARWNLNILRGQMIEAYRSRASAKQGP